jgi:hypothetical protein
MLNNSTYINCYVNYYNFNLLYAIQALSLFEFEGRGIGVYYSSKTVSIVVVPHVSYNICLYLEFRSVARSG